jgi:hypothetical protein
MDVKYGTLSWRQKTCSYCSITFESRDMFTEHWHACPHRIRYGYIENPNPSAKERWGKIKAELQ